ARSRSACVKERPTPNRRAHRTPGADAPQEACNEPDATGQRTRHHLPASAENLDRHQSHRSEPVAANVPHPAGAGSFLLQGRAKCSSAARLPQKRVYVRHIPPLFELKKPLVELGATPQGFTNWGSEMFDSSRLVDS